MAYIRDVQLAASAPCCKAIKMCCRQLRGRMFMHGLSGIALPTILGGQSGVTLLPPVHDNDYPARIYLASRAL